MFFLEGVGSLPLVPAVETKLFCEPGQPPGVYGALFGVASPPPPPVLQTQNLTSLALLLKLRWRIETVMLVEETAGHHMF